MPDRLFLIDGHALIFKMYYAFLGRPMINSKGVDTSILFGFTKFLLELAEHEKPTHMAVAFDPPGGTFRHKLYPDYKGTRPPTPQLVIDALEPLSEIVRSMNMPVLMVPGFEADDVIGSVARRAEKEGFHVYMVTPDKDYGQLISDTVFQYKPGKAGNEREIIDPQALCARYGISKPLQIIDMLTICGDASDNVPGVKGVGEVGARRLIARYGSIQGIYDHISELAPRQKAMFEEAKDHIDLSRFLVTIKTDIDLPVSTADMAIKPFSPRTAELFDKYEFRSLKRYLGDAAAPAAPASGKSAPEISVTGAKEMTAASSAAGKCAVIADIRHEGASTEISKMTAGTFDGRKYLVAEGSPEDFRGLLADGRIDKYGFGLKRQAVALSAAGIGIEGRWMDVELMHYVLDPERSHRLDALASSYLGMEINETEDGSEAAPRSLFDDDDEAETDRKRFMEIAAILQLGEKLLSELERNSMSELFSGMEEPLAKVLAKMELRGVKVDPGQLEDFAEGLRKDIAERQDRIREMTDEPELNISSPRQVGEVLFGKLGLDPKARKNSKGSYSTDESTLLDIADRHPVVEEILEFRAGKKLLSTYIEPLPGFIDPSDGRIHTTFNQALTATGRLSSSNPNLQNIPIRTDMGKEIRRAFVPGTPGGLIMSADYSQIELRIMAHLSGDEHLIKAFREGIDVHAATAARIFGIPHEEVSDSQRRIAKTANFGIMYGISAFGLAQRLRLPRGEAKKIIDDYFANFPAISTFINASIASARENGYVETIFGRRRYLPGIDARNSAIRSLAERNAVNAPIQGTAADIIKLSMIRTEKRIEEAGLKSRMVLQIHDELLFDTLPEEAETLRGIVKDAMENVIKLSVPLTVECGMGKNWLEAH